MMARHANSHKLKVLGSGHCFLMMAAIGIALSLCLTSPRLADGHATAAAGDNQPTEPPIFAEWRGYHADLGAWDMPRAGVVAHRTGKERIPVEAPPRQHASDPMNATYTLEGEQVRLQRGRAETVIAPGSASRAKTSVLGEAVHGDLDDDGDDDVALVLIHSGGGSGSFYYVAVARNLDGKYLGSNAVSLGDRIGLREVAIRNGLVIVGYLEHGATEAMTTAPTLARTMVLEAESNRLTVRALLEGAEQLLEGWLVIGHEVRSFTPCGQGVESWLLGDSPALRTVMAAYRKALPDAGPYAPLFVILAGISSEPPTEGFGADYAGAIAATQLIGVGPRGECPGGSMR